MNKETTNRQNIINYLSNEIYKLEEKIYLEKQLHNQEKKVFPRNMAMFISALFCGIGTAINFSNTTYMIPALIISTPIAILGTIGTPLCIVFKILDTKERKKEIKKYRRLLDSTKKRKQYEIKLLENSNQQQSLNTDELLEDLIRSESKETKDKESDSLLVEDKKKFLVEKAKEEIKPHYQDSATKQELSYDEEWLIRKELETYAFAIKPLLKAKKNGVLAEFLRDNYNVTDEESISMYDALLEEEMHSSSNVFTEKESSINQLQKKIVDKRIKI